MTSSATPPTSPAGKVAALRDFFDTGATKSRSWRLTQLEALAQLLTEQENELIAALHADLAKPPAEGYVTEIGVLQAEIRHVRRNLRSWLAPQRVKVPLSYQPAKAAVIFEPLGVMLVIAPWNYPLQLLLSPLIGGLAAGNAVVLKPSEHAGHVSRLLAELLPQYVDGTAVVEGAVAETTELLEQRFDHIVYTGGAEVGRIVMRAAAEHLTPVTLELGGKSPAWVDETTDLARAARRIAWGKFTNAGQTCVAPDYVLAPPAVARELEPLLARAIRALYGHDPYASPDYGRLISAEHTTRLITLVDDSVAAGAKVVCGGQHDVTQRYLAPTVLGGVSPTSPAMAEEIFGPVLPIVPVADLTEAIGLIAAGDKPLSLYAFTTDAGARRGLMRHTSSGSLAFDAPLLHVSVPTLPFGGVGASGMGAYHGKASLEAFSNVRPVLHKPLLPETLAAVMPPFTKLKSRIARMML